MLATVNVWAIGCLWSIIFMLVAGIWCSGSCHWIHTGIGWYSEELNWILPAHEHYSMFYAKRICNLGKMMSMYRHWTYSRRVINWWRCSTKLTHCFDSKLMRIIKTCGWLVYWYCQKRWKVDKIIWINNFRWHFLQYVLCL